MSCHLCAEERVKEFPGELVIHFAGPEDLNKPKVLIFPKLKICLGCGAVEFLLPKDTLLELRGEPELQPR
jgi:hypothetical protein